MVFVFGMCAHSHVHALRSRAQHPVKPLPPSPRRRSVCFLPLELSRQDVSHAAQNGLVLPRPFQVELKAADAAALIARLLGFCGHGCFLWGEKNDSLLHSGRTNLTVRSKHARSRPVTSEQRRVDTEGDSFQLSVNLHCYSSLAPASEAHSLWLHNSCKLNFASISEAAAAVQHFQSRSLISAGRPRHLSHRFVKDPSLGTKKVHFHVVVL